MRCKQPHFNAQIQGVWLLKPKVLIMTVHSAGSWTGREEPDHAHNAASCAPEVSTDHPNKQRPYYNTAHTTADLISCMGGATPPHSHNTPAASSSQRAGAASPLTRPRKHLARSHLIGNTPPKALTYRTTKPVLTTPNRKQLNQPLHTSCRPLTQASFLYFFFSRESTN